MPSIRTYSLPSQKYQVIYLRAFPQRTAERAGPYSTSATHPVALPLSAHYSLITYHCSLSNFVSTTLHSPFLILNWSHTFSAKERDVETGLSYFGARYYSSDLSIWLSVDPMSDKYPSLSPYVYCANNPVKLVDPNGEEIGGPDDPPTKYIIKKGDTFWDLENARNLPHGTLQRQNPSLDPNNLQVGTEINYPYMQGDLIISDNSVPTGDIPEYYNQPTSNGPVMDMSNYDAVSPLIAMMGIQDPRFFKRSPVTNAKFTYKKVCSIRSFEDIVRNPKLLWGKSQQEMEQILGKGWTGGKYCKTGEGWRFTKGDKSVFYHNAGRHKGAYYGFSSGKTGKVKVVGKGYVPSSDDKSTIIYYTK